MKHLDMHAELLEKIQGVTAKVALSGYAHPLYDEALVGWRRVELAATTQVSARREVVWMNYQPDGWL